MIGPEIMNLTRSRKTDARDARVEAFGLSLRQIAHARRHDTQAGRSNLEVICPMAFFATASGLTMDKVRFYSHARSPVGFGSDTRKLA